MERARMARARSDAPSRPDRPPGSAALALRAERGAHTVSLVRRARRGARDRGGPSSVCVAPLRDAAWAMCWH